MASPVTPKPLRSDARQTREALVRAAEQLFSEQGIEAASLNEITRIAGQKNRSALGYHFGSREALLDAVLSRHATEIGEVRAQMLASLTSASSLREVVEALVLPLAAKLDDPDGGTAYLRICAQMFASQELHLFRLHVSSTRRSDGLMQALLPRIPSLPPAQAKLRMQLVGSFLFHSLSDHAALQASLNATQKKQQNRLFIHHLIDSIVAMLSVVPQIAEEKTVIEKNND